VHASSELITVEGDSAMILKMLGNIHPRMQCLSPEDVNP
jgi:hypothetical protein